MTQPFTSIPPFPAVAAASSALFSPLRLPPVSGRATRRLLCGRPSGLPPAARARGRPPKPADVVAPQFFLRPLAVVCSLSHSVLEGAVRDRSAGLLPTAAASEAKADA